MVQHISVCPDYGIPAGHPFQARRIERTVIAIRGCELPFCGVICQQNGELYPRIFLLGCILSSKNPWYCHENSLVVANRIPWSLPNKIPGSATLLHPHEGVSQAVAWAIKSNQVPMMGQAVNHGGRHLVIGKNGAPLRKLQIGGNDQAAPFVAA